MAETCSGCGHVIGARCTDCAREMVCGVMREPCPVEGCLEGVLDDPMKDLVNGPWESPRRGDVAEHG